MRFFVGTSGYSYKEWRGTFYPEDARPQDMLRLYAERLDTVEINNTFYRMPSEALLLGWSGQVPDGFSFALKASRRITHQQRLADSGDVVRQLLQTAAVLGPKLGPTLFQLPPDLPKDLPRLAAFLDLLPPRWPAAFEFRHASWISDDVHDLLRGRGVALVVADTGGEPPPIVPTAGFGYLRLRREVYDDEQLAGWAARVAAQPWDRVWVFFKHEDGGVGPQLAARFAERAPQA
jgi:uncharacterized protein YecE (DUF72 family)